MTGIEYIVRCVLPVPLHLNCESRYSKVKEKYQSPIWLWRHRFQGHGIMFQSSRGLNLVLPLVCWMVFDWVTHNLILPQRAWEFRLRGSLYAKINRSLSISVFVSLTWGSLLSPAALAEHVMITEVSPLARTQPKWWADSQIFEQVVMALKLFKRMELPFCSRPFAVESNETKQ